MAGVNGRRLSGRLAVHLRLYPPTQRSFDIDNRCKGVLDGLTYAKVWLDDSQVDRLTVTRGERVPGGLAKIYIQELAESLAG
jgi:crossover junction endodeoxyribonuclease RusA